MITPSHLNPKSIVNLGSFYTPEFLVEKAHALLQEYISSQKYTLLDSSCGAGNFLLANGFDKIIGADIDKGALDIARSRIDSRITLLHKNTLYNVSRGTFGISESEKLIIIGNPPYNDRTSIVQRTVKNKEAISMDLTLQARDIGISFLRSYEKLQADYVCVLHPLSYLIKKTNFQALKDFAKHYRLLNSLIISSKEFCKNSKKHFPIVMALYKREDGGMDYNYICKFNFQTLEGKSFRLNDFEYIGRYINKYPNKLKNYQAMFYTMRDINALARSKTFLDKANSNTVYVPRDKYSLYCYVDVFKAFLPHIPYYFGNCDVMIDFAKFKGLENSFVQASEEKIYKPEILQYFKDLLGIHYLSK